MENFYSTTLRKTVQQISMPRARKLYERGVAIFMNPCNMRFDNVWTYPSLLQKSDNDSFESIVNSFIYYCCNAETGKYPRFYVAEADLK